MGTQTLVTQDLMERMQVILFANGKNENRCAATAGTDFLSILAGIDVGVMQAALKRLSSDCQAIVKRLKQRRKNGRLRYTWKNTREPLLPKSRVSWDSVTPK